MSDIRLAVAWRDHPKREKLRRRVGADGVLAMIDLWLWAGGSKPDGFLDMDDEDIELAANWRGEAGSFVKAAVEVGLLDLADGGYLLHDWTDHQAWAAGASRRSEAARENAMKRWEAKRGATKNANGNAAAMPPHRPAMQSASEIECGGNAPSPSPSPTKSSTPPNPPPGGDASGKAPSLFGEVGPERNKPRRKQAVVDKHRLAAVRVLEAINAARKRVRPSVTGLKATDASLAGIAGRLDAGYTVEDCLHVVGVLEAEVRRNPESWDFFDAVSPWRPDNFERKLARSTAPRPDEPIVVADVGDEDPMAYAERLAAEMGEA